MSCVFKQVVILRFYEIIYDSVYTNISPVAQMIQCCVKYKLFDHVLNIVSTCNIPTKHEWKRTVNKVIYDYEYANWKIDLK